MKHKYILYMAAGNSQRFGERNKLLHPLGGKPLYQYGLDLLRRLVDRRSDCSVIVITRFEQIITSVERLCNKRIRVIPSPESEKGVSYTVRKGLDAVQQIDMSDFILFMVADQPYLSMGTVEKILSQGENHAITSLAFGGVPANPVLFSARFLPELYALRGDEGGRKIARSYAHMCHYVEADGLSEVWDLDDLSEK